MAADVLRTRYLSRTEAAEALGIATRTLDRWWTLRVGPPRTHVGQKVYYRREAVESWLLSQETTPVRDEPPTRRRARAAGGTA